MMLPLDLSSSVKKLPIVPRPPSAPRSPGAVSRQRSILRPGSGAAARSPRPASGMFGRMDSGFINVPKTIDVAWEDNGRLEDAVTQCKIIFVIGWH